MVVRQVALIRGINVGKSKRVAMSDLRALLEELGYRDVVTILNSGNAVFTAQDMDTKDSANRIQETLLIRTGISAKVTVLTGEEIKVIVDNNPFGELATDPTRLIIAVFMHPEVRQKIISLVSQSWSPEALYLGEGAAYLWCPNGVLASGLSTTVNKILGDSVTSRNLATLMNIYAIVSK